MSMLTLREAAALIPDATILGDETARFERISTDSRTAGPGDLFVALKGERFDAHEFLGEVAGQGVSAALVSRSPADWRVPALRVPDTRVALAELARGWRAKFKLPLVAVTGSNGKTTVKGMIASIFAAAVGEPARLATAGNLNNDIGVPLTLLRLNAGHELAVIELGMNHPGETELLARIAQPTIGLINNAQREHQEFMSTVEAVALEHASVIHALADDAHAVFPADDAYAAIWRVAATDRQIVDFALDPGPAHAAAIIRGERKADGALHVETPDGAFDAVLHVIGDHNLRNALAATAAAWSAGVSLEAIKAGLEQFEPVAGRLQRKAAQLAPFAGMQLIDDTYNANPDSMRAAIAVLAAEAHPRVLVIGDMGEVGDYSKAFHREIGEFARDQGIDAMYALGAESQVAVEAFGERGMHFETVEALLAELTAKVGGAAASRVVADAPSAGSAQTTSGTQATSNTQAASSAQAASSTQAASTTAGPFARGTILVKGSRFMRMERVVRALTLEAAPGQPGAH